MPARQFTFSQSVPHSATAARNAEPEPASDHHLWRNGRLWWVAFTVHRGWTKERIRRSLNTPDLREARRRRDSLFQEISSASECTLSLRF
jgi:hypothetical protein